MTGDLCSAGVWDVWGLCCDCDKLIRAARVHLLALLISELQMLVDSFNEWIGDPAQEHGTSGFEEPFYFYCMLQVSLSFFLCICG